MVEAFLVVTLIVIMVVVGMIGYLAYKKDKLPKFEETSDGFTDPDKVACTPEQIYDAWLRGLAPRERCQDFSNNLVVSNEVFTGPQLYEKDFRVDPVSTCCWFSNRTSERTIVPQPWVCNGTRLGETFTLQQLNQKAYAMDGDTIKYLNPSCDTNDDCISLARKRTRDSADDSFYQIDQYKSEVVGADISSEIAQNARFYFERGCANLVKIVLEVIIIVDIDTTGTLVSHIEGGTPDIIQVFLNVFNDNKRFYPVAIFNPELLN
jgi:hypothetical protein